MMLKIGTCQNCGRKFQYEFRSKERSYCCLACQRQAQAKKIPSDRISDYNHRGYMAKAISERYGNKCAVCGWELPPVSPTGKRLHTHGNEVHHIIPVSCGGKATWDNLILLCPNCHKAANNGYITADELMKYHKNDYSDIEKQEMKNRSVDRISASIFG